MKFHAGGINHLKYCNNQKYKINQNDNELWKISKFVRIKTLKHYKSRMLGCSLQLKGYHRAGYRQVL